MVSIGSSGGMNQAYEDGARGGSLWMSKKEGYTSEDVRSAYVEKLAFRGVLKIRPAKRKHEANRTRDD